MRYLSLFVLLFAYLGGAQAASAQLAALRSSAVVILDPKNNDVLYQKNPDAVMPIASLTKLMTALVVLESKQNMSQMLEISSVDVDRLKYSSSRLQVGTRLSRTDMLHLALMSSENRAAAALGRNYPGGTAKFVAAMNRKARALGMRNTRYVEPTGLSHYNVSTPSDLAKLVIAAEKNLLIRRYSTGRGMAIRQGRSMTAYHNTNRLTASPSWRIRLQKTGYINEAGHCMVLYTMVNNRPTVMVFLDSQGKYSHAADANRVKSWLAGYQVKRPHATKALVTKQRAAKPRVIKHQVIKHRVTKQRVKKQRVNKQQVSKHRAVKQQAKKSHQVKGLRHAQQ